MEELKPCPWCGETKAHEIVRPGLNGRYFIDHFDAVFHLQSSIGFETAEAAAEAWNNGLKNSMKPFTTCSECSNLGFKDFDGICEHGPMCGIVKPWDYCSHARKKP